MNQVLFPPNFSAVICLLPRFFFSSCFEMNHFFRWCMIKMKDTFVQFSYLSLIFSPTFYIYSPSTRKEFSVLLKKSKHWETHFLFSKGTEVPRKCIEKLKVNYWSVKRTSARWIFCNFSSSQLFMQLWWLGTVCFYFHCFPQCKTLTRVL